MKEDLVESVPEFALYSDSEVIQYIAGYLIKKLKLNECADKNRQTGETFLYYVNNGGLKIPKADFQDKIEQLEVVFKENILKKELRYGKDLILNLCDEAKAINLSEDIKVLYFKIRMYARLRYWNKQIEDERKKKQLSNKYKKILYYLMNYFSISPHLISVHRLLARVPRLRHRAFELAPSSVSIYPV